MAHETRLEDHINTQVVKVLTWFTWLIHGAPGSQVLLCSHCFISLKFNPLSAQSPGLVFRIGYSENLSETGVFVSADRRPHCDDDQTDLDPCLAEKQIFLW